MKVRLCHTRSMPKNVVLQLADRMNVLEISREMLARHGPTDAPRIALERALLEWRRGDLRSAERWDQVLRVLLMLRIPARIEPSGAELGTALPLPRWFISIAKVRAFLMKKKPRRNRAS